MTLPGLAFRNGLLRNKTRAILTVLGVAVLKEELAGVEAVALLAGGAASVR
jgi:hypothetical protein